MRMKFTFLLLSVFIFNMLLTASCSSNIHGDLNFTISLEEGDDATSCVYNIINKLSYDAAATISFEKGTYHFYPEFAYEKYCYISNHNDVMARIAFMLKDKRNLTIDGNGSKFIFHGRMIPFLMEKCKNIRVKNLSIDFAEPFHSESIITSHNSDGSFDMSISKEYPYEIRNGQLVFVKPYYEHSLGQSILYDPTRKAIAYQTEIYTPLTTLTKVKEKNYKDFEYKYKTDSKDDYIRYRGRRNQLEVKQLKPGLVRVYNHRKKMSPIGMVLASKGEQGENRFAPAFKANDTEDFSAENVIVHHAGGMGFLFENCSNVDLYKCVVEPSGNRMVSTTADATHFVGCRGKVSLRNCVFHNQLDDAMNVHGAYQEVYEIIDDKTLRMRVGHFQQLGFRLACTGDTVGLVRLSDSFHAYHKLTVKGTDQINGRYQIVYLNESIPDNIKVGDLLENLSAYPEVLVENCDISRNRARGLLISTPKKTVVKNNYFSTEMEAILLPVESSSWFESGNAANVTIEDNTFQDCTIGGMDRGVICFRTDEKNKNMAFSNINIKSNTFNHFDNLILQITNVDGLTFTDNIITNSGTYPQQFPDNPVISVVCSKNLKFNNNVYKGKANKMLEVVETEEKIEFK